MNEVTLTIRWYGEPFEIHVRVKTAAPSADRLIRSWPAPRVAAVSLTCLSD